MEHYTRIKDGERQAKLMKRGLTAVGAVLAMLLLAAQAHGQEPKSALVVDGVGKDGKIRLMVNKGTVLTTRGAYKRVSVGQPEVADVNTIDPRNILVTAKKSGSTQLIIWDDQDKSQVIDVIVDYDLEGLGEQLKAMFPNSKIEVASVNGAIALRGRVSSLMEADQATQVASPYSQKVLNFLEVSGGQQILLKVRFAEVSRQATSQLGVNFTVADGSWIAGSNVGAVNPLTEIARTGVGVPDPLHGFDIEHAINPSVTLFGSGQIGSVYLAYFLNALRQNNLMRMLAEPNLIAISGQEADFLAGGEFPIPVTQGSGSGDGGTAITIEYREFGVKLRFTPVVLGDGRIRIKVNPEVSDLDFTTAVRFGGFLVPGLTTRKITTTIELAEGQTFAIAGLLNNQLTANSDVIPLLGDLPILGTLFRSVRYTRKETELVVLVTPYLVEAINPDQVATLPGEKWRHPTEGELFWKRDLGGEMPESNVPQHGEPGKTGEAADTANVKGRPAPMFRGEYGFTPAKPKGEDPQASAR